MIRNVPPVISQSEKTPSTFYTIVQCSIRMYCVMLPQSGLVIETFVANGTSEWFLICMNSFMPNQFWSMEKTLVTVLASVAFPSNHFYFPSKLFMLWSWKEYSKFPNFLHKLFIFVSIQFFGVPPLNHVIYNSVIINHVINSFVCVGGGGGLCYDKSCY